MIKTLSILKTKKNFLNFIKEANQKHIANVILKRKTPQMPLLKSGYPLAWLLSTTKPDVIISTISYTSIKSS